MAAGLRTKEQRDKTASARGSLLRMSLGSMDAETASSLSGTVGGTPTAEEFGSRSTGLRGSSAGVTVRFLSVVVVRRRSALRDRLGLATGFWALCKIMGYPPWCECAR